MLEETKFIWMNGKMVPWKEATVHVLSHSLHYGVAAFEGIRCYNTENGVAIFRLREHIKRLFETCKIMWLNPTYTQSEIEKACIDVIKANGIREYYIRPIVYRDYGGFMGVHPKNNPVCVAIAVWPWGTYLGDDALAKGIRVKISSYMRHHPNIEMTKAKLSAHYANAQLAKIEAAMDGYEEAVMLSPHGTVAEGTGENIFIYYKGKLKTPPLNHILPGITRETVMEIARKEGIEVQEEEFSRDELYIADEAFLCGTAAEVTPIREVEHRPIGTVCPGAVTKKLQEMYLKIVHGQIPEYTKWLTIVE